MGHSIQFYEVEVSKGKKGQDEIERLANYEAEEYGDYRSPLNSAIRWIDVTYDSYEEAENAILNVHDKGWYDQLAVKYKSYKPKEKTKAIINQEERLVKLKEDLEDYFDKNALKNKKTQYVGCKNCGSKINKDYISGASHYWNKCNVCSHSLASKTTLKTIENKKLKIEELEEKVKKMIIENNQKGKATLKWLVKTEYHV